MDTNNISVSISASSAVSQSGGFYNSLEPDGLIEAFRCHPPADFEPAGFYSVCGVSLPAFRAKLNLFTTMDGSVRVAVAGIEKKLPSFIKGMYTLKSLFVGTTVTEYAVFPKGLDVKGAIEAALGEFKKKRGWFLIFKDIPRDSPLLTEEENSFSRSLLDSLDAAGFVLIEGQGLAYLPIDFGSTDEFLMRFSRSRRKDFRRKLRALNDLTVDILKTGNSFFTEESIDYLYGLYINVYERSTVHFDKLSREFFYRVFMDGGNSGVVFLYRLRGLLVGFNLCFVHGRYFVDKYVGFMYPQCREANLYFVSWFKNIEYCLQNGLETFVAGWTDPEIKAYLGAKFTFTRHAVYCSNPVLRLILKKAKSLFESDGKALQNLG